MPLNQELTRSSRILIKVRGAQGNFNGCFNVQRVTDLSPNAPVGSLYVQSLDSNIKLARDIKLYADLITLQIFDLQGRRMKGFQLIPRNVC